MIRPSRARLAVGLLLAVPAALAAQDTAPNDPPGTAENEQFDRVRVALSCFLRENPGFGRRLADRRPAIFLESCVARREDSKQVPAGRVETGHPVLPAAGRTCRDRAHPSIVSLRYVKPTYARRLFGKVGEDGVIFVKLERAEGSGRSGADPPFDANVPRP